MKERSVDDRRWQKLPCLARVELATRLILSICLNAGGIVLTTWFVYSVLTGAPAVASLGAGGACGAIQRFISRVD